MKIYHKKNFKLGLWSLVLAALLLAAGLWRGNFDWKDGVLCALGKWNGSMLWVGAGLGLMAAFLFALAADFITWVYYDEHT